MFLLIIFCFFLTQLSSTGAVVCIPCIRKAFPINDIPDPLRYPEKCGASNVEHSYICDPDFLFVKSIRKDIDTLIFNHFHNRTHPNYYNPYNISINVVIIAKMQVPKSGSFYDEIINFINPSVNIDSAAKRYAQSLHHKWHLGLPTLNEEDDEETASQTTTPHSSIKHPSNTGILIFLSVRDDRMYISVGKGIEQFFTDTIVTNILHSIHAVFLRKGTGNALYSMIKLIHSIFTHQDSYWLYGRKPSPLRSRSQFHVQESIPLFNSVAHDIQGHSGEETSLALNREHAGMIYIAQLIMMIGLWLILARWDIYRPSMYSPRLSASSTSSTTLTTGSTSAISIPSMDSIQKGLNSSEEEMKNEDEECRMDAHANEKKL